MAGIVVGVGILGIDHKLYLGSQREHFWILDGGFRERSESYPAMDETRRQQIWRGEFGGIAIRRPLLVGKRLPPPVHRPLGHFADDLTDILDLDAAAGQAPGAIDIRLRHRSTGIRLEGQRIDHPSGPEIACQGVVVAFGGARESVKQPVDTLEYGARTNKTLP